MNELPKAQEASLAAAVRNHLTARLGELGLPYFGRRDTALDARHVPYDCLRQTINEITEQYAVVVHGSGKAEPPYPVLKASASALLLKVPAVYASTDARVGLGAAVLARNRANNATRYLADGGNGFAAAMHVREREKIFESPPGMAARIFAALKGWPPERDTTFCDGLVYFLARSGFTQEDTMWDTPGSRRGGLVNTDHEWNAAHDVTPLAALRISATLAPLLFTPDTIHVYSKAEMTARHDLLKSKRALVGL